MEVAALLHQMAAADGIPAEQLLPLGMTNSASFDDLLRLLAQQELLGSGGSGGSLSLNPTALPPGGTGGGS